MKKRFFIRKSPNDLIQEQNKLLEIFMCNQKQKDNQTQSKKIDQIKYPQANAEDVSYDTEDTDDNFTLEFEDIPYIHVNVSGDAKLPTLNIDKQEFDASNIEKLKEALKNKD